MALAYVIRHGETAWSLSGQHTGTTDIPLTENGRRMAERLRPALSGVEFTLVLVSPMQRAQETCRLAGLGDRAIVEPDLMEWNYGTYEGSTSQQIHATRPGWTVFRDGGGPGGEAPEQVAARADRVIARVRGADGTAALFAHGHIRVLAARWIGLPARAGEGLLLDTGTLCILDTDRGVPALRLWNAPLAT